eukprot:1148579-Pelagomonas_calceolata.AAC.9
MRTHLHAKLIQATSNILEHSPYPVHFYEAKANPGIIDNEGADACARAAALTDAEDIKLPNAKDPFYYFYWLSLDSSPGRNGEPYHSRPDPTHYLTNLADKLKTHMHKRHKLS